MTTYAKLIEGKPEFFKNPLVVNGQYFYNPGEALLKENGYKIYKENTPDSEKSAWCDISFSYDETEDSIEKICTCVPNLEKARTIRTLALQTAFDEASKEAHCASSAGFEIDADEIANRNIEGLVLVMQPEKTTLFRAYDNSFHEVTREQLEIMRKEIVINSQYLYQAKWTIEAQIMQAQTAQAVADIDISADTIAALADTLKAQAMEAANGEEGAGDAEAS